MFCSNCGSQIPDGSVFCPNCGTQFNAGQRNPQANPQPFPQQTAPQPFPQQTYAQPVYGQQPYAAAVPAPKKKKKTWLWFVLGGVVLAAVALVLILVLGGNSPESVAKDYFEAYIHHDIRGLIDNSAYDYLEREFGVSDEDELVDWANDHLDGDFDSFDDVQAYYDKKVEKSLKDIDYSISVKDVKELEESKWADVFDDFYDKDQYRGVYRKDVEEMYKVTLLVSASNKDTEFEEKMYVWVVKVDGKLGVLAFDD